MRTVQSRVGPHIIARRYTYLGGRGDGLNILLGHGGSAIDEWARQALERKPSITLDPLKNPATLTVIITRPLTL